MLVQVTREHIEQGHARSESRCPIALALGDMGYRSVRVNGITATMRKGKETLVCNLPEEAEKFVMDFDRKGMNAVKPFKFIIERVKHYGPIG